MMNIRSQNSPAACLAATANHWARPLRRTLAAIHLPVWGLLLGAWAIPVAALDVEGDPILIETLRVPADRPETVRTRTRLTDGYVYLIEASGVFSVWSGHREGVDAVWCYATWRCGEGEAWNQLRIDGSSLSDIEAEMYGGLATKPYDRGHVYSVLYFGRGKPLELSILDAQKSWTDNSGGLEVRLYRFGERGDPVAEPPPPPSAPSAPEARTGRSAATGRDPDAGAIVEELKGLATELTRLREFLTWYDQLLRLEVASDRLGTNAADARLSAKGRELFETSFTETNLRELRERHRRASNDFLSAVESRLRSSKTWPDPALTQDYRALALGLLEELRYEYLERLRQGRNPLVVLVDALELREWSRGKRQLARSRNPFAGAESRIAAAIPDPYLRAEMEKMARALPGYREEPRPKPFPTPGMASAVVVPAARPEVSPEMRAILAARPTTGPATLRLDGLKPLAIDADALKVIEQLADLEWYSPTPEELDRLCSDCRVDAVGRSRTTGRYIIVRTGGFAKTFEVYGVGGPP